MRIIHINSPVVEAFTPLSSMRFVIALLVAATLLLLSTKPLPADELVMINGDRITGKVLSRKGDKLKVKTSYAGVIAVEWKSIQSVHTDTPMTLQIAHDRVLQSHSLIKKDVDNLLLADTTTEEEILLEQEELTAINPQPWILGRGGRFTGNINIAAKVERGNNVKNEVDVDAELEYRRKHHRGKSSFSFENDEKYAKVTKHKWRIDAGYDYFQPKSWSEQSEALKWYYGITFFGESDEFADLTLRAGLGPHSGRQFFEGYEKNLKLEIAFLRIREEFQDDYSTGYWAPSWQIDFDTFLFAEILQFYHRQIGYWGVDNDNKLIWNSWTGFRVPLWGGFIATTELEYEYDSAPAGGAEKEDTTYRLKLGYSW
jgi:putative salt-induced outer membrane protein YdiY